MRVGFGDGPISDFGVHRVVMVMCAVYWVLLSFLGHSRSLKKWALGDFPSDSLTCVCVCVCVWIINTIQL